MVAASSSNKWGGEGEEVGRLGRSRSEVEGGKDGGWGLV